MDPRNMIAHSGLGRLYFHLGQNEKAAKAFKAALAIDPAHLDTIGNYALLLLRTGNYEDALKIAGELAIAPKANAIQRRAGVLVQAGSLRRLGRVEEALDALERLAEALAKEELDWAFHKERGLALEALGQFSEAFRAFVEGNQLFQKAIDRNVPAERETSNDLASALESDFAGMSISKQASGEAPVFIVGFRQSGHQVLTALCQRVPELALVETSGVFPALRLQLEKGREDFPAVLAALEPKELEEMRVLYRSALKILGAEPGKILVHASPANLYELPLILKMFPGARFIYVLAHPLDTCLHCFFTEFLIGRATRVFSDLNTTAAYFADTVRLWEKFKTEMTFSRLEVRAEDVFDHTEAEIDRVLDFIRQGSEYPLSTRARDIDGLNEIAFDQKTLAPPGRWRNFREAVAPLVHTLAPVCRRLGYPAPQDDPESAKS